MRIQQNISSLSTCSYIDFGVIAKESQIQRETGMTISTQSISSEC